MSLKKVLLIEDIAAEAELHTQLLKMSVSLFEGRLEIHTATSWAKAVEMVATANGQNAPYDAVSLDLGLPDTTGPHDTILRLAEVSENWPPVVITTGYLDNQTRVKALIAGAEAVLGKDELGACAYILWRRLYDEALKRTLPKRR